MTLSAVQLLGIAIELALMIVLPVVAIVWWCRRRRVPASVPLIAAGFYLLMTLVLTWLFQRLEKRHAVYD